MKLFQKRFRMLHLFLIFYSLLYLIGCLAYLPIMFYRRLIQGKKTVLAPRLRPPRGIAPGKPPGRKFSRIWVHAVSVGEVNAVRALVTRLHERGHEMVVSTTTETGQRQALNVFREIADVFYFPLDIGFICRRFLRQVNPSLVLLAETEIWPNFVRATEKFEIPLILTNGRISDASFQNYRRLNFLFRPLLKKMDHLCMQSKLDKERIIELGAASDEVNWVGNLKFDYRLEPSAEMDELKVKTRALLAPASDSTIWLCGSTKPGEEELLLSVFKKLRRPFPLLNMVLAPRHPHRAAEIKKMIEEYDFNPLLRSEIDSLKYNGEKIDILIVDTIGELAHLYEVADLVFVGGSLVPMGGQNLIEAAAFGKPILFGPNMQNFREIARAFVEDYAALQVSSPEELATRMEDLLKDEHARQWLGRNARKVIRNNQGAVERTLEIVESHLDHG